MTPEVVSKYLESQGKQGHWQIDGCVKGGFVGVVVIPALAESNNLFATLQSLAQNPPELLSRVLVLVIVNHCELASADDIADNLATLSLLNCKPQSLAELNLSWIDAASPGRELPLKHGGVGLARRIGLDLALTRLDYNSTNPFLVCLDADTLVRHDYLATLVRHFNNNISGGAVINFRHQKDSSVEIESAILRYELFLRSYVFGLSLAGSPYAFHTVGSAMACRASAYVKIGGMNSRNAGEDFYFLQQLSRTVGVAQVHGTVVYPSCRASHRVPFGTGRSMSKCLDGDVETVLFYHPECFRILGQWLTLVHENLHMNGSELQALARGISTFLAEYLESILFADVWKKLQRNNRNQIAMQAAFDGWFDGLKTMKFIHYLSAGPFPRQGPVFALSGLFEWAGSPVTSGIEEQMAELCKMQLGDDYEG